MKVSKTLKIIGGTDYLIKSKYQPLTFIATQNSSSVRLKISAGEPIVSGLQYRLNPTR